MSLAKRAAGGGQSGWGHGAVGVLLALAACNSPTHAPEARSGAEAPAPSAPGSDAVRSNTAGTPSGVAELCVGEAHSCLRTTEGRVACWGDNEDRQVAPVDDPQLASPRWLEELPPAAELRCGEQETCVRTASGDVACLGGTDGVERLALPEPAVDLVLHRDGGCAALASGQVQCWERLPRYVRRAASSEPGAGVAAASRTLWPLPQLANVKRFLPAPALAEVLCAIGNPASSDPVRGAPGAAGTVPSAPGSSGPVSSATGAPICVRDLRQPESVRPVELAAGDLGAAAVVASADGSALCGPLPDGQVRCEGSGVPAQPFSGAPAARADVGGLVPYDGGLCVLSPTEGARCAGAPSPLVTALPARASMAALGFAHACALLDGQVECWGQASRGQLGSGPAFIHAEPLLVSGVAGVTALDASPLQACAATGEGLSCWGALPGGGAAAHFAFEPQVLPLPAPALEVRAAHLGAPGTPRQHALEPLCARSAAGWWCWQGDAFRRAQPDESTPLQQWKTKFTRASSDRQCGVTAAGELVCAGEPSRAGNRTEKTALLRFSWAEPFVEASGLFPVAGEEHVCGRSASGKVACFRARAAASEAPVDAPGVSALQGIVQLAAGRLGQEGVACALDGAGAVHCWGGNRYAQSSARPSSSNDARTSGIAAPWAPTRVEPLPPAAQLAVGGTFACARTQAAQVYCWGDNRQGTAPNGAPGVQSTPRSVRLPSG